MRHKTITNDDDERFLVTFEHSLEDDYDESGYYDHFNIPRDYASEAGVSDKDFF